MNVPDDLRYTKDHEWVRLDADGVATIGITDYAQGELGDIVFVRVDDPGTHVDAEAAFGEVEAVKTVSELFSPVAGTVEDVNAALNDAPDVVNRDPYGEGWMAKIRPDHVEDVDRLLRAEAYREMIGA
jgi:glycine cleavage system H protein